MIMWQVYLKPTQVGLGVERRSLPLSSTLAQYMPQPVSPGLHWEIFCIACLPLPVSRPFGIG